MREIRKLRVMWRELETGSLTGHHASPRPYLEIDSALVGGVGVFHLKGRHTPGRCGAGRCAGGRDLVQECCGCGEWAKAEKGLIVASRTFRCLHGRTVNQRIKRASHAADRSSK